MDKEQIKKIRKALGWTWERMAQELSVSVRTVARWERGESEPRGIAERILRDLEVKFFGEEEVIKKIAAEISQALGERGLTFPEEDSQALAERVFRIAHGRPIPNH